MTSSGFPPGQKRWLSKAISHSLLLRLLASCAMLVATTVAGQSSATTGSAPRAIMISILEGEGELNDVRARTAREPIVQVEDENHKPIAGALVLFSIPSGGPSGATFSGLSSLTVRTGADGRAVGRGFRITRQTGSFQIKVVATVAALQAEIFIHQTNFSKGGKFTRLRKYSQDHPTLTTTTIGLAAVAAVATVIVLNANPAATQITAGTGVVGR